MVPLFHGQMRAGKRAGTALASWNAAVEHTHVREGPRRVVRARRDEQHAKTWRLAIVLFLFPGLLATALLIGGHAIIDPVLRAAAEAREASRVDRIVFTMPDVAFCRHLSFNNETAELTEGTARCPEAKPRGQGPVRSTSGFAWDTGARAEISRRIFWIAIALSRLAPICCGAAAALSPNSFPSEIRFPLLRIMF